MQIFIRGLYNNFYAFDCDKNTKLEELKIFLFKKTGLPRTWQYFIFNCKSIYDGNLTISDYNIDNEATLHLLLKWHGIGCNCQSCLKKGMLLRNGKRVISSS